MYGTCAGEPHPASERLQDGGQSVVLKLEEIGRLTVHLETVGVVVEFHRAHKVAVAGQQIGELGGEQTPVTSVKHRSFIMSRGSEFHGSGA